MSSAARTTSHLTSHSALFMPTQVEDLQAGIESALRTSRQGTLLRQGLQVAIVGRPNVGKSRWV